MASTADTMTFNMSSCFLQCNDIFIKHGCLFVLNGTNYFVAGPKNNNLHETVATTIIR